MELEPEYRYEVVKAKPDYTALRLACIETAIEVLKPWIALSTSDRVANPLSISDVIQTVAQQFVDFVLKDEGGN